MFNWGASALWRGRNSRRRSNCRAIAYHLQSEPELADAYGTLLTEFELASNGASRRSLLVTSTQPSEGKTTTAAFLAVTALMAGRNVLLIDGDFKRPAVHRITGLSRDPGLGNLLYGQDECTGVIQQLDVLDDIGAGRLSVVTCGEAPPNVLHLVSAAKRKAVLDGLAQGFDLVLVDTPPALAVNDAELWAPAVDGVILVVAAGEVEERRALMAKQRIERTGTPILGVVLNRFNERLHGAGAYPYHGYYTGPRE